MIEHFRRDLGRKLGLTPTNPWLRMLSARQVLRYYMLTLRGQYYQIPPPIFRTPNGMLVLGDPDWHERKKCARKI